MDNREQRGRTIAASGGATIDGGSWRVVSQSNGRRRYRVNPYADTCSCPDHEELGIRCKHLWAVIVTMTTETTDGGTTRRVTYSQQWSAYNAAQTCEKDMFTSLLADLAGTVPQPEQTIGRPRLPLGDMAFATTYKVFSRFSSRRFTCDLRDAASRGLIARAPHFNSVSRYMASDDLTPVLHDLITLSSLPLKAVESEFAVDSSGFSSSRYLRWLDAKHGQAVEAKSRGWLKAHLMVGTNTNVVTSAVISGWASHDTKHFAPLVRATAENFDIAEVSADKAYLSRANLALVEEVGAVPYVPFKSSSRVISGEQRVFEVSAWERMYHRFAADRDAFLAHYHRRSNVETTFSMVKAKFGDAVLSKSETGQANEVLCKVLAHNICCVISAVHELGIEPRFAVAKPA